MKPAGRVAAFAGGLVVALVAAFGIGATLPQFDLGERLAAEGDQTAALPAADDHSAHGGASAAPAVSGLSVTDGGFTLHPLVRTVPKPGPVTYRFRILGPDGVPVRDFRTLHERELHLIVVRRDMTRFQHVHPTRADDGTWSIDLVIPDAGAYRVFADIAPVALQERANVTLGTDLLVGGSVTPQLPAPKRTAIVDGVEIVLAGAPEAGASTPLRFSFRRGDAPVEDLEPYLGAFGHLVALREGDLAYAHVHAGDAPAVGGRGGPDVEFTAEFPTPGRYALFLDFSAGGKVQTAAFALNVARADRGEADAGHGDGAPMPEAPAGDHGAAGHSGAAHG